jgi:hypothetical protein
MIYEEEVFGLHGQAVPQTHSGGRSDNTAQCHIVQKSPNTEHSESTFTINHQDSAISVNTTIIQEYEA